MKYGIDYVREDFENLFKIACSEMESGQYAEAEKHFDSYVLKKPDEWKGLFYRAFCKCHHGRVGDIVNQANIFEGAFYKALGSILSIEDKEEREDGLHIIINFLIQQASFFIQNGKRVGGVFGSASVGSSTVKAGRNMLRNCIAKVEPYCNGNAMLINDIEEAKKMEKTGSKTNMGIIILAVVIGIITFFL